MFSGFDIFIQFRLNISECVEDFGFVIRVNFRHFFKRFFGFNQFSEPIKCRCLLDLSINKSGVHFQGNGKIFKGIFRFFGNVGGNAFVVSGFCFSRGGLFCRVVLGKNSRLGSRKNENENNF